MGFTTQVFTFIFFPLCVVAFLFIHILQSKGLLCTFLKKIRATDLIVIAFSLGFYMWTCFDDVFRLCIYMLVVYVAGVWIQSSRRHNTSLCVLQDGQVINDKAIPSARIAMCIAMVMVVLCLVHFKYTSLLTEVWNFLFKDTISGKSVLAPLGISFITFSAISYLADIYMGKATAGNLIDCVLYLCFFPKVVSGPIVLWRDFQPQIKTYTVTLPRSTQGLNLIMIGFAKKIILADQFGAKLAEITGAAVDVPTAWGAALLYMLQIYFDFSGYSDIAIGLAKLFGYDFKANFNFPYLSCSISEFWRRWHISLGAWFREYIYFPLGGSHVGKTKTLFNLAVVFALTGIWHGAGWNYMLWGGINGAATILERLIKDKSIYQKTPTVIKWAFTMLVTLFCWELYRYQSLSDALTWSKLMFGIGTADNIPYTWQYYFDSQIITLMAIGVLGSTVFGLPKAQGAYQKAVSTKVGYSMQQLLFLVLFVISILFMVNSTYSPFIYFQY